MSGTEVMGFVTGALCVWLGAKENIWTWPIGIANNLFYLVLFWQSKLYADASLQVFYIVISIYGWSSWLRGGEHRSELKVRKTNSSEVAFLAAITALSTVAIYALLRSHTDSTVPFGDGLTTAMSLTAQYMMSRKILENWSLWIAADVIYIGLYSYKHLYLTAFLYLVFIAMCIVGYIRWSKTMESVDTVSPETESAAP